MKKQGLNELVERMLPIEEKTLDIEKLKMNKEQEEDFKDLLKSYPPKQAFKYTQRMWPKHPVFGRTKSSEYVIRDRRAVANLSEKMSRQKLDLVLKDIEKFRGLGKGKYASEVIEDATKELIQKKYKLSKEQMRDAFSKSEIGKEGADAGMFIDLRGQKTIRVDRERDLNQPLGRHLSFHEEGHFRHAQVSGRYTSKVQKEVFAEAFSAFASIKMGNANRDFLKDSFKKMAEKGKGEYKQIDTIMYKLLEKYPNKKELLQKGPLVIREITNKGMDYEQMLKKLKEM